ncbi:MAG: hypothetical protein AAFN13_02465 [Bacteroidota bacterium]
MDSKDDREYYELDEIRSALDEYLTGEARWHERLIEIADWLFYRKLRYRRQLAHAKEDVVNETLRKIVEPVRRKPPGYHRLRRKYTGDDHEEKMKDLFSQIVDALKSEVSNLASKKDTTVTDRYPEYEIGPLELPPDQKVIAEEWWSRILDAFREDELVTSILKIRQQDPSVPARVIAQELGRPVKDIYYARDRMLRKLEKLDLLS